MARADLIRKIDGLESQIINIDLSDLIDSTDLSQNFLLKDQDVLRLYSKDMFEIENKITVTGSINKPGEYALKKDMTVSDLILEAGGLIENRRMFFCRNC